MNSILSKKKNILLKKQCIRRIFVYGLFILISNLISGVSFGGFGNPEYNSFNRRFLTFIKDTDASLIEDVDASIFDKHILTEFTQLTPHDFAREGYFYTGVSKKEYTIVNCFSCGEGVRAKHYFTSKDLRSLHSSNCKYINSAQPLSATSFVKPPPSTVRQRSPESLYLAQPPVDNIIVAAQVEIPDGKPDLAPIDDLLSDINKSASLDEKLIEPRSTTTSNEYLLETSGKENPDYKYLYEKMYLRTIDITEGDITEFNCFHRELQKTSPVRFGVLFDMSSNDTSFPVIVKEYDNYPWCSFQSVRALKNMYFDYKYCRQIRFLFLSLMMEMDRKLLSTISKVDDAQHIDLKKAFADSSLCYRPAYTRVTIGVNATLSQLISKKGEVIGRDKVIMSDAGVLLYMAPRHVLLENTVNIMEVNDLIHSLSKMFFEKIILSRLRQSLLSSEIQTYSFRREYEEHHYKTDVDRFHMAIPNDDEIGFIVIQHICIFYMWELWGLLKNGHPLPEHVEPNMALVPISIKSMKLFVLEAVKSIFDCSIKELQAKINKNHFQSRDSKITQKYADKYIEQIVKNMHESESLNLKDDDCFRGIFPDSKCSLSPCAPYISSSCVICLDDLKNGVTEMIGFRSCRHSMEEKCWRAYEFLSIQPLRCPMCRIDIHGIYRFIYKQ
ncbi:MAG: hypothetical protein QS748_04310 [Candidatus Endonucleobacter bathymodioli]|uniref:RING-type domain-containing protein n=1 Tax=Candidatus Endonucleibacter bathymodioli TaxID=539814 RepID=A0AA90NKV4_9GAMM|nr:hypothetical protein [Candidatus Endonucleobacter bathymodioli]